MGNQEIFDTVVRHLFAQGRPAMDEDESTCMYRGVGGTKCAVGCLIPDECYSPSMEENSVRAIQDKLPNDLHLHVPLLMTLQSAHDNCSLKENGEFNRRELKARLRVIATDFGLDQSALARKDQTNG